MTCMLPRHVPICYNEGRVGGRWSVGCCARCAVQPTRWMVGGLVIFSCLKLVSFTRCFLSFLPWKWFHGALEDQFRFQQGHFLNTISMIMGGRVRSINSRMVSTPGWYQLQDAPQVICYKFFVTTKKGFPHR